MHFARGRTFFAARYSRGAVPGAERYRSGMITASS